MHQAEMLVDTLGGLGIFADLPRPQLEAVAHVFEEASFAEGERILRQGLTGSNFYVILEGEAAVLVDGEQRAVLGRGDYFGELSVLLGEPPVADVVALRPLRCLALPGAQLEQFLLANPKVMLRILHGQARRLRSATRWRS